MLQLAFDDKEDQRQIKLDQAFSDTLLRRLDQPQAEAVAGVGLPSGGLYYPEGGWVHPPALCQWQAGQPNITLLPHHDVVQLRKVDGLWQAWDGERLLASAPLVVLASAADIHRFEPCAELPLKRIRGQITRLPATNASRALGTVVCADGYVAPPRLGEHTLGRASTSTAPTSPPPLPNMRATWSCCGKSPATWQNALAPPSWNLPACRPRSVSLHQPRLPADRRPVGRQGGVQPGVCRARQGRATAAGHSVPLAGGPVCEQRPWFARPDHRASGG